MLKKAKLWERQEAERRFADVLAEAKAGTSQEISDPDGVFIVSFKSTKTREPAGAVLARGGPLKD